MSAPNTNVQRRRLRRAAHKIEKYPRLPRHACVSLFVGLYTRLAPKKAGSDEINETNFVYYILVFVADGIEGVPIAVYLLVQELVALVSNNHVELRKSRKLACEHETHTRKHFCIIHITRKVMLKLMSSAILKIGET